ncbi:hypothetical protein NOCARDAX2BIS_610012 [Nocardioides sp. AX2bis]|nr:hypothetical protein NOCARDAX2BIS_610012 [Nocardioides sp. AX2bis]
MPCRHGDHETRRVRAAVCAHGLGRAGPRWHHTPPTGAWTTAPQDALAGMGRAVTGGPSLGVKGSQVQILSARHSFTRSEALSSS